MSQPVPVILGTGITGLAASYHLSKAGVKHLLVGPEPDSTPKLGESLDISGTADLLNSFGWLSDHFYPKSFAEIKTAQNCFHCSLLLGESGLVRFLFGLGRQTAPSELIHLDRLGFDRGLSEEVRKHSTCEWVTEKALQVQYEPSTDKIVSIYFKDKKVTPSFVVDCTTYNGPVAQAAKLPVKIMGRPQTVAFCHFWRRTKITSRQDLKPFERQTNLFRIYENEDGLDGFGWCISMGNTMSVGIAMDTEKEVSADRAVELASQFLLKNKLPYLSEVEEKSTPRNIRHPYFFYEKLSGTNYLLAGPSACQIWYMTGSGVGCGLLAARMIPKWLKNPKRIAEFYQRYVKFLFCNHETFERLRYWDQDVKTKDAYQNILKGIARSNFRRTAHYYGSQGRPFLKFAWEGLYYISHFPGALGGYCDPLKVVAH